MCGSTAVDTAMKIALAYHRSNGEAGRVRFVGRERGYHGVGFGGINMLHLLYDSNTLKMQQLYCRQFIQILSLLSFQYVLFR